MYKYFFRVSIVSLAILFMTSNFQLSPAYSWPWDAKPKAKFKKGETTIPSAAQPQATEPKPKPVGGTTFTEVIRGEGGKYSSRTSSVPFGDADAEGWKDDKSEKSKLTAEKS